MTDWKNEKPKLFASWTINTPEIYNSARQFANVNPNAPILYRASIKPANMQKANTPVEILAHDTELHFVELGDILWTLKVK